MCAKFNCLSYLNEESKLLICGECDAIYNECEFTGKIFSNVQNKSSVIKKIFHRLSHVIISYNIANEYLRYLKLYTKMNFKNVLEIGANYGCFIKKLETNGINTIRIESDKSFIDLGVSKNTKCMFFTADYHTDEKYDLICLTQMIYFLRDNYAVLNCVKNMLSSNGLVFITTSSGIPKMYSSPTSGKRDEISRNMILSKKNYESFCKKLGFEIVNITNYHTNFKRKTKIDYLKIILKLRKQMMPDPNGEIRFILLKSIDTIPKS